MDPPIPPSISSVRVNDSELNPAQRGVAFPQNDIGPLRAKGLEMKKTLTIEARELAEAGYEHIDTQKQKRNPTKENTNTDIQEHTLSHSSLSQTIRTSFDSKEASKSYGLTEEEAAARLSKDGKNVLTPPRKKSAVRQFLERLLTLFNVLLIVAGILVYALLAIDFEANFANTYLGAILIVVAFINASIDFYQIQKSEAILASFLAMIPPTSNVVRNGTIKTIPASNLVKGDVVLLRSGDKTPADIIVFSSADLKLDNSSLTGESEPQDRFSMPNGSKLRAVEAENLAFNSTLVVNGEAWGVVVRTGDHTFIGQIASLTGNENSNKSPLAREIGQFVILISCFAMTFALVFFAIGLTTVYKGQISLTITFAISVLVAFVPEGLPSVVMLLLSIAAKRMAAQNVLVKDLQGVETLGSLTLLATDKTGTLTKNQMTVTNVWSGEKMYSTFQSNNDEETTTQFTIEASGMKEITDVSALNSRIKFDRTDIPFEERKILGDATETGLTRFAARYLKTDYDEHVKSYQKAFEVPFNSTNKWALVILKKTHLTGCLTAYLKGAPERVLAKCKTYLKDGKQIPITDDFLQSYDDAYSYMASRGHRVIGCAQYLLPGNEYNIDYSFSKTEINYPSEGYCFLGLVSLEDPPKHGVREAIGTLRLAGIKVMMITGDHPKTAEAVARKINLILGDTRETLSAKTGRPVEEIYDDETTAVVIHGDDIDKLEGWQWDQIFAKEEIVFARTTPQHKLEIVKRAQSLGHVVGVTGDGVNDSPALKKADLGIAMNISGSDVSKEAANMILLDDNFASTVKGVAEGRLIFNNLKRSIQYTMSHSTPEIIPQLLYVVVPLPLPITAILILVIDLGFDFVLGLSFAWDKPETDDGLMRLSPRRPVNAQSILARKKRALRRSKTLGRDSESQTLIGTSRIKTWWRKIKAPFTKVFWQDLLEQTDYERLVDRNVLSYAYLEAGMISAIGNLLSYFIVFWKNGYSPYDVTRAQKAGVYFKSSSPDFINYRGEIIDAARQVDALAQGQAIVYLSIFITQCFNVFAVKAKLSHPFGKRVIANKWNFASIVGGACVAMFIVYTPPLQVVFGCSYRLSPLYWLISFAFGGLLLVWATIRVRILRKSIEGKKVKDIKGLVMFPTMRTMSIRSIQHTRL